MKYLILPILFVSFSAIADQKDERIDIEFIKTPLSAVVAHLNKVCIGQIEPVLPKNPELHVSLGFVDTPCSVVAKVIRDVDDNKSRETDS